MFNGLQIKFAGSQVWSLVLGRGRELVCRDSDWYSDIVTWSILVVLLQSVDDNDQIIFILAEVNVIIECYRVECAFRMVKVRQEFTFLKEYLWDWNWKGRLIYKLNCANCLVSFKLKQNIISLFLQEEHYYKSDQWMINSQGHLHLLLKKKVL